MKVPLGLELLDRAHGRVHPAKHGKNLRNLRREMFAAFHEVRDKSTGSLGNGTAVAPESGPTAPVDRDMKKNHAESGSFRRRA